MWYHCAGHTIRNKIACLKRILYSLVVHAILHYPRTGKGTHPVFMQYMYN